jgi:ribose transport system ATP-binding protein
MSDPPPVLLATNPTKRYPGVLALHNVGLTLHRGEILAVIGENGAGKSTLMKILAGIERADAGEIQLDGRPTTIESVRDASAHGIALIHQELNLTDNPDISGNVFLGREPRRLGRVGLIDRKRLHADARVALKKVLLDCAPSTPVALLSPGGGNSSNSLACFR